MDWVDQKYINLVSGHLQQFKRKDNVFNFRCPYCGDSKKSKTKSRGFLLEQNNNIFYKCHNCGVAQPFSKFLEHVNTELLIQYKSEKFKEKFDQKSVRLIDKLPDITNTAKPVFIQSSPLKQLRKISQLKPDHPAKKYVDSRLIPSRFHHKLFYTSKFQEWVNSFIPDKFDLEKQNEPRLVIPFLDEYGNFIGVQGRSFSKTGQRYITIIVNDSKPKLYGLDHTDIKKRTYMFEGPIDSLFIPNSLAMAGSDCIGALQKINHDKNNLVFVYDNEPRNKEIVKNIERTIESGYNVCIWPAHIEQKDVNDMVLAGMKPADIKLIIDNNTFSGLEAKLQLTVWKKC